jgi:hypothetical protein
MDCMEETTVMRCACGKWQVDGVERLGDNRSELVEIIRAHAIEDACYEALRQVWGIFGMYNVPVASENEWEPERVQFLPPQLTTADEIVAAAQAAQPAPFYD